MPDPHRLGPVLFSAEQIDRRVRELAADIAGRLAPGPIEVVAVLSGCFVFLADLVRRLAERNVPLTVDFLRFASYGAGTNSSGRPLLQLGLRGPIAGRTVLLVDDILDTGLTLRAARDLLLEAGAAAVHTCVLLDKPARRRDPLTADFTGFRIDNVFVVGYGLDYDGFYRHLPYVAVVQEIAPEGMATGTT